MTAQVERADTPPSPAAVDAEGATGPQSGSFAGAVAGPVTASRRASIDARLARTRPVDARPRKSAVLRFFSGVVLSMYGDWLTTVALVVVLFQVTGTVVGPAGYVLARVAPRVLGPLVGGGLIDRFSARRIATATAVAQGAVTVSLIWSHDTGAVWAIYAAVVMAQLLGSGARPAQVSLVPTLVPAGRLARANAVFSLANGSSIFIAPAIGALLLLRTGPDLLFAVDAASFLASAALIATLPRLIADARPADEPDERPGLVDARGAIRALRDPAVRTVATANFAIGLAATVTQSVLVVAAHDRFHDDASVGFLYSAVGAGCILGGIVALLWSPPDRLIRTAVALGYVAGLLALAGFGLTSWLIPGLLLLATSTVCETAFDVWGTTAVQRRAPRGLMGRYNSLLYAALYGGMLLGAVWALAASPRLRWDAVVEIACLAMVALVVAVWVTGRGREISVRGVARHRRGGRQLAATVPRPVGPPVA